MEKLKTTSHGNIKTFHSAPQPNCQVNADATKGHAFGIFMTLGCALRPGGLRRRLPR
jgi:hypothetical protein